MASKGSNSRLDALLRVAELEDAIAEGRQRVATLARESATDAPTFADVAPLLDRLPLLANSLTAATHAKLRPLFESLQLDIVFQPAEGAVDVSVTLYEPGDPAAQLCAEDWSAPPA